MLIASMDPTSMAKQGDLNPPQNLKFPQNTDLFL